MFMWLRSINTQYFCAVQHFAWKPINELLTPEALHINQPNWIETAKVKKKILIKHVKSIFTLYVTGCFTYRKVICKILSKKTKD